MLLNAFTVSELLRKKLGEKLPPPPPSPSPPSLTLGLIKNKSFHRALIAVDSFK